MAKKPVAAATRPQRYSPYPSTDYRVGERKPRKPRPLVPTSPNLSPKTWFKMLVFGLFPLFNFIPLTAWARRKNPRTTENQKSFAKAAIILSVCFWVVVIIAGVALYFMGMLPF